MTSWCDFWRLLSLWYLLVVSPGASSSLPLIIISSPSLLHWWLPGDCSFWYKQETQVSTDHDHLDASRNLHSLYLNVILPWLCFPIAFLLSPSSLTNQNCGNVLYYFISLTVSLLLWKSISSPQMLQHSAPVFPAECAGSLIPLLPSHKGPMVFWHFPDITKSQDFNIYQPMLTLLTFCTHSLSYSGQFQSRILTYRHVCFVMYLSLGSRL